MDEIRAVLATFAEDERKEFARFLQRQKKKKERKDLELFQLLVQAKPLSTDQMLARLYPEEPNATAYYALRKRLMRHISGFILLKRLDSDTTAASSVMGLLSLARYLFDTGLEKAAWQHLLKAEKLAAEHEQFDLLNGIYNLQIEKARSEFAPALQELIRKRNLNKEAADEEERANIANSLITQRLQEVRSMGRLIPFDQIVQQTLEEWNVKEAVNKRPSLLYKLMSITRSAVLVRRDFHHFEPYIIEQYQQMDERRAFGPQHRHSQLGLLHMIAHVLYRTRKFGLALQYLGQMGKLLENAPQALVAQFYPRYIFLLSACHAFLNELPKATSLLEELLKRQQPALSNNEQLIAHMQLSFYFFARGDFQKSWRILQQIDHSDSWCEKRMGKEWVLKKKVGEVILQLELGNPDLALTRLQTILRQYKSLLSNPTYHNEVTFLELLQSLINNPRLIEHASLSDMIEMKLKFLPAEQEDLPHMSFYAWLKSKITKQNYFDLLREMSGVTVKAEVAG